MNQKIGFKNINIANDKYHLYGGETLVVSCFKIDNQQILEEDTN